MKIPPFVRAEMRSHLRIGCAERRSDYTFICKTKGKHGSRLPYFVAGDILNIFGDQDMRAWAR